MTIHNYPDWLAPKSRFPDWDTELAESVLLKQYPTPFSTHRILQSLIVLQHQFGSVSVPIQEWLAQKSGIHISAIRTLIEFYSFLTSNEPSNWTLRFAGNIIEHHSHLHVIMTRVKQRLSQYSVSIETTSCIGLSDHPVSVLVNGFPVTGLCRDNVDAFCDLIQQDTPIANWPEEWFKIENHIRHPGLLTSYQYKPGIAASRARDVSSAKIIELLSHAGLRGLGGAGFPTAQKWDWCARQSEPIKYIACNADEGEPGTFKDRYFLTCQLDQLIEGMIVCAHAVSACKGFIYLRAEYQYLYQHITERLQHWRNQGYLGEEFEIELHLGAGAYICGEESAMIESLQGKPGIPTAKPPYPVEKGLFNKPTVVNNVETFISATQIMQEGPHAFSELGTPQSKGSRLHSVSGDCSLPGLYELEQGTPLQTLLDLCGANNPACVQLGGPSGRLVSRAEFHLPLDFENPGRGGSVMIFDDSRSTFEITENFSHFFRHESCGFCTPCRAGTVALCNLLTAFQSKPQMRERIAADIQELVTLMRQTSHCGLGKTAGLPVVNLIQLTKLEKVQ